MLRKKSKKSFTLKGLQLSKNNFSDDVFISGSNEKSGRRNIDLERKTESHSSNSRKKSSSSSSSSKKKSQEPLSSPTIDLVPKEEKLPPQPCDCPIYQNEILNLTFKADIDKLFTTLYDEDSSVMKAVAKNCRMTNYKVLSVDDKEEGLIIKTISHDYPIPFMGITSTNTLKQLYFKGDGSSDHYKIQCTTTTLNIPYSQAFEIVSNTCIQSVGKDLCTMRITCEVVQTKRIFFPILGFIKMNSIKAATAVTTEIVKQLILIYGQPVESVTLNEKLNKWEMFLKSLNKSSNFLKNLSSKLDLDFFVYILIGLVLLILYFNTLNYYTLREVCENLQYIMNHDVG